jgi:hypothetical protein
MPAIWGASGTCGKVTAVTPFTGAENRSMIA